MTINLSFYKPNIIIAQWIKVTKPCQFLTVKPKASFHLMLLQKTLHKIANFTVQPSGQIPVPSQIPVPLFWYFHCWLWTGKCRLGYYELLTAICPMRGFLIWVVGFTILTFLTNMALPPHGSLIFQYIKDKFNDKIIR